MATLVTLETPKLDAALLAQKQEKLFAILGSYSRVMVAYSGGTDSAYLAWAAQRVLGDNAIAITADSASIPESHKRDAEAFARECGIRHEYIETHEFDNPEKLHQVKAPLVDAGLTKAEIRELSRLANLSTWDRPAAACLSSRIPYGTPVTVENVKTVERGEEEIRLLGFRQFRVRFHGELVRIEIAKEELDKALTAEMAQAFVGIFKPLGFHYVTIDLEGYRQGSLNSVLKK